MPIPIENLPESWKPVTTKTMALVPYTDVMESVNTRAALQIRAMAHILDIAILQGFSLYLGKAWALLLVATHFSLSDSAGVESQDLILETMQWSGALLSIGFFMLLSLFYFVAFPMWTQKTFGLGIFGLKVVGAKGRAPNFTDLLARYFWCLLTYLSFGVLALSVLRSKKANFIHDQLSETSVVKN